MKQLAYIVILASGIVCSAESYASAGDQTLVVGYSRANADWVNSAVSNSSNLFNDALQGSNTFGGEVRASRDSNKDISGAFIKYRYELDNSWGAIVSANYLLGDYGNVLQRKRPTDDPHQFDSYDFKNRVKSDYFTIMAGPSYRINEFISVYATFGMAYSHIGISSHSNQVISNSYTEIANSSNDESRFSVASSLGLQANVWKRVVVDVAYEIAGRGDWMTNGLTLGLGYQF